MKLLLAPMEGVVDSVVREVLTEAGGLTHCATEFIRITSQLMPPRVFFRYCPELREGGTTSNGVPVFVQLLGGQPAPLAENAQRAVELGAPGIDLNFGCPARTVNRHDGGAALLRFPDRIFRIVSAVRRAVPSRIPVSAKIRLGYESPDQALEIASAVEAAGASWLSVHARTKTDGYRPPAHWEWLARIREAVSLEVVANGDIWDLASFVRCREVSGCGSFMLGRGLLSRPNLAAQISYGEPDGGWTSACHKLRLAYQKSLLRFGEHHAVCRTKQWMRMLGRSYPEAADGFERIKRIRKGQELWAAVYNLRPLRYQAVRENNYVHSSRTAYPG